MSRLIVRGLPSRCTDAKLKKDFGSFGTITDCSLKYTKDGKFRRMAFIGFNEETEAANAINHFNGSFMGTSKLIVGLVWLFIPFLNASEIHEIDMMSEDKHTKHCLMSVI